MKNFWLKLGRLAFLWVAILLVIPGCKKDDPEPEPEPEDITVYEYIQAVYYHFYYWNKEVNSYIVRTPPTSGDPKEYFESLKYNISRASASDRNAYRYDRWGFMYSYQAFTDLMTKGENVGFGYLPGLAYDPVDGFSIRVCFTYDGSPMAKAGVKRGYELLTINGKKTLEPFYSSQAALESALNVLDDELAKSSNTFLFADLDGNPISNGEIRITASDFTVEPVYRTEVYQVGPKKVGYVIYNEFLTGSKAKMIATLNGLAAEGVDELVLDLRYNGGGDTDVAERIAECLLPQSAGTDSIKFSTYVYSDLAKQRVEWLNNETHKVKRNALALNLQRLFIITSYSTASASEEIVNGMKPFFPGNIILVGTETNGKPVGMNVFTYPQYDDTEIDAGKVPEWIIAPITFRVDNKNGEGGYFTGISPTFEVYDDLFSDFGIDEQTLQGEECLQTIIEYIQTGKWTASKSTKAVKDIRKEMPRLIELKGIQIHAGCI